MKKNCYLKNAEKENRYKWLYSREALFLVVLSIKKVRARHPLEGDPNNKQVNVLLAESPQHWKTISHASNHLYLALTES